MVSAHVISPVVAEVTTVPSDKPALHPAQPLSVALDLATEDFGGLSQPSSAKAPRCSTSAMPDLQSLPCSPAHATYPQAPSHSIRSATTMQR